jgi:hypothetical protein
LTDEIPYAKKYPRNEQVMFNITQNNVRPDKPDCEECTPAFWNLLNYCWDTNPLRRWSMTGTKKELKKISKKFRPLRILVIGEPNCTWTWQDLLSSLADHSYSRMNALFGYLRKLELELSIDRLKINIGRHFDLICGSSFGGFAHFLSLVHWL